MDNHASAKTSSAVEIDRFETETYVEVLWSNGRKIRFFTFGDRRTLSADERAQLRRRHRAARTARRANGDRRKALMAQHGIDPANIKFSWQP
jgi:hypothetical protein